MQYRNDRYGNPLSILGFGCMRFPQKAGRIDLAETEREILAAIKHGVNYFDTAYIYPGSEAALGEILARNGLREKVNIATKLPHYLIKSREALDKLFAEELRRLQTDHVDYYLMHMLSNTEAWTRLCDLGILQWLEEKKNCGAIRQVCFSYHGNTENFCRLLDAYDWDFCQIQYNYMDEHSQAGRRGLQYAAKKGIPIVIMEPLRGGKLVHRLPEKARKLFASAAEKHSPAGWAFLWLWDQPEVTVVLSGMNSLAMVEENCETASSACSGILSAEDKQLLENVRDVISANMKVGCTGCGYCQPCPKGVDIPGTFAAYNRRYSDGKFWGLVEYFMCTALRSTATCASRCVGCGKCEQHCPQGIPIRQELKNAQSVLEGPVYRIASKLARKFVHF